MWKKVGSKVEKSQLYANEGKYSLAIFPEKLTAKKATECLGLVFTCYEYIYVEEICIVLTGIPVFSLACTDRSIIII